MVSTDDAYVQADITILSAKVSGYVTSLAVGHNQSVKAGDLIATIDDGDFRLARQATLDKLATQRSAIVRIGRQIEAENASVAKAEAQVAAAQADAQQAASDFGRQQQLAKADYASKADLRDRPGLPRSGQCQCEERAGLPGRGACRSRGAGGAAGRGGAPGVRIADGRREGRA